MKDKVKKTKNGILKKKKLLGVILGITLVIMLIVVISRNHMSTLEKKLLIENSNTIMNYYDKIESKDNNGVDNYILFALEYSYNENDKDTLHFSEIKKIIQKFFSLKIDENTIEENGISPLLLLNNVSHNIEEQSFTIDKSSLTQSQIASIPIVTYKMKKMKKRGSDYIVKYEKYEITNPYEILNYYNDLNESDSTKDKKDTTAIFNYLTCQGKVNDVKDAVNDDILKKIGKKKSNITIIYHLNETYFMVYKTK